MKNGHEKNHYEVLQVDRMAGLAVIRGAYRALLKNARNHPDLGGSQARAQAINEAFSVLSDPTARRDYDRQLEMTHPALEFQAPLVRTEYILICPSCRKRNHVDDDRGLERMLCGACKAQLLPPRRMAMETDHSRAFRVGIYLFDKGMMGRSLTEFEAAVRLEPKNAKYHYWLGRCQYQMHRYEKSRKSFLSAVALNPRRFHFHFWLGQINYALKEFADAIRNFTTALKVRPRHSPTLLRLASCFFHVKDYARSVRLLEKAILREPARLQLYTLLGVVYLASKNHSAALSAFRHAEKISPKDTFTQRYLNILGEE